jgi:hypothetical protein
LQSSFWVIVEETGMLILALKHGEISVLHTDLFSDIASLQNASTDLVLQSVVGAQATAQIRERAKCIWEILLRAV